MTDIILHGARGRMGHMVAEILSDDKEARIVAGIDKKPDTDTLTAAAYNFPVYENVTECGEKADVVIDFSTADAVSSLLDFCEEKKLPLVLCTTGLSSKDLDRLSDLLKLVPVLRSANMSLGVNVILKILSEIAPVLCAAGFDAEIVEKHHRKKLDAPSGTALALADAINEALVKAHESGTPYEYVFDRSERRAERPVNEIGISALRGGTIVGEHDVVFAGTDETITLSHEAFSRAVFAKGAIAAAKFLKGKEPALYTMGDVVSM